LIAEALESSEAAKIVLTLYRKNGTTFMAAMVLRPVYDQDGECTFTMGFLVDVGVQGAQGAKGALKMSEITALLPQVCITIIDIIIQTNYTNNAYTYDTYVLSQLLSRPLGY
jgi:fructose-specific phosphotransferase system component IIB